MALIGQGAQLQHSTDGTTYTTIAKLTEIGEISFGERDDVDVTNHQSTGGYREFIPGLADGGEIDFTGLWEAATSQQTVINRVLAGNTGALDYFKIVLPGNMGTFTTRGYFKSAAINPQLDDLMEFTGTFKVSGQPTFVIP